MYDEVKDYTNLTDKLENKYTYGDLEIDSWKNLTSNENLWMTNTRFNPKVYTMENKTQHEKELEERPINSHFHPVKGYKWDIPVPEDQKYVIENDRLGDMITLPRECVTLFRFVFLFCLSFL